jgi:hypothetical protein
MQPKDGTASRPCSATCKPRGHGKGHADPGDARRPSETIEDPPARRCRPSRRENSPTAIPTRTRPQITAGKLGASRGSRPTPARPSEPPAPTTCATSSRRSRATASPRSAATGTPASGRASDSAPTASSMCRPSARSRTSTATCCRSSTRTGPSPRLVAQLWASSAARHVAAATASTTAPWRTRSRAPSCEPSASTRDGGLAPVGRRHAAARRALGQVGIEVARRAPL